MTRTCYSLVSGTSASPITVGAYPGERVEVSGWFKTAGDYIVLGGFEIDGSYGPLLQSPYDDNGVNTRPALGVNARSNFVTAQQHGDTQTGVIRSTARVRVRACSCRATTSPSRTRGSTTAARYRPTTTSTTST